MGFAMSMVLWYANLDITDHIVANNALIQHTENVTTLGIWFVPHTILEWIVHRFVNQMITKTALKKEMRYVQRIIMETIAQTFVKISNMVHATEVVY